MGDTQPTGGPVRACANHLREVRNLRHDRPGLPEEQGAARGEHDPPRLASEERSAKFLLKIANLPAERGLGHMQGGSRPRKTGVLSDS
jgi:hypothetical protein